MHNIKKAAITREGFEYQDCLGMEFLIEMYIDPDLYEWVQLDSEDLQFQHVDDIVAKRKADGKFVCRQVKFRVDPERDDLTLSFEWLTEIKGKTDRSSSLLQKWAKRVLPMLEKDEVFDAKLLTNARPDGYVTKGIDDNGYIDFDQIPDSYKSTIISQLSGEEKARQFFRFFQFEHSKPVKLEELARQLRDRLVPAYTDDIGWYILQDEVRKWSKYKKEPPPEGCIRFQHVSQIISKKRPRPIPQDFSIPNKYRPPDRDFHRHIVKAACDTGIIVICGSPGRGKSTYISYLCKLLTKIGCPLVRHHYFLSLEDLTGERYRYSTVASSLQHQMKRQMPEVTNGLDQDIEKLKECIEACAKKSKDKPFVIVIDGLDHVWRENSDIDQMRTLFNRLLPVPENVTLIIGTQDVPEEQLPQKLLQNAPKNVWKMLPLMSVLSIRHWLNVQAQEGSLDGIPKDQSQRDHHMNNLSESFHGLSGGHPLHLVYSFKNLVAQTKDITIDVINALPKCPDGDILQYYEGLWSGLSSAAKEFLHLFAATDFYWPENGLYQCLGYDFNQVQAFNNIRHLLDRRRTALVPFHGSILVFIKAKEEHSTAADRLLPKAVYWLENDAADYWRWAWLWLTQAKIGHDEPIIFRPSRDWAIDSLCKGYPQDQMELILDEAERVALKHKEYCRLQELRFLKVRVQNGPEFQTDHIDLFQHCVSFLTDDLLPFEWMADNLSLISDMNLVTIARRFKSDKPEVPDNCLNEMNRRAYINSEFKNNNHLDSQSDSVTLATIAAYVDDIDPKRIIDYTKQFSTKNFQVFQEYINHLFIQNQFERLLELWKQKIPLRMAKNLVKPTIRLACREQISLDKRGNNRFLQYFALSRCWLKIVKDMKPSGITVKAKAFSEDFYDTSDFAPILYEHFFLSLDVALNNVGPYSFIPLSIPESLGNWIGSALKALEKAARETAKFIQSGQTGFNLAYWFNIFEDLEPPNERVDHKQHMRAQSLRITLIEIFIDLYLLFAAKYGEKKIEFSDLESCKKYTWWNEYIWFDCYVKLQLKFMTDAASKTFFDYKKSLIQDNLSEFSERTNEYAHLSKFALFHGLDNELKIAINLTADNMLGYGSHKDVAIFSVLDAIEICQKNHSKKVSTWLHKLRPIIKHITDITTGDETRHARGEYHDILSKDNLYALIQLRSEYLEDENWYNADQALASVIKFSDFNSPEIISIIETATSDLALSALENRAQEGNDKALELYIKQRELIGKSVEITNSTDKEKITSERESHRKAKNEIEFDCSVFPPKDIDDFIKNVKSRDWSEKEGLIEKWLGYWTEKGKGIELLEKVNEVYENPSKSTYFFEDWFDIAFELSKSLEGKKKAYKWLVRAHIRRNGWDKNYAGREEVRQRLDKVAKEYPNKWQEYIDDTADYKYSNADGKRKISIGQGELVRFLFLVGQNELAEQMTDILVNIALQEMADQPLGV